MTDDIASLPAMKRIAPSFCELRPRGDRRKQKGQERNDRGEKPDLPLRLPPQKADVKREQEAPANEHPKASNWNVIEIREAATTDERQMPEEEHQGHSKNNGTQYHPNSNAHRSNEE